MRSSSLMWTTLAKEVRNQCKVMRDSSVSRDTDRNHDRGIQPTRGDGLPRALPSQLKDDHALPRPPEPGGLFPALVLPL